MGDSRQRPSCGSLHTGVALACSSITSSPEKQPLNQPFKSFMRLLGPNLGPSNQNEHGEPFKRSGLSSYELRLVVSWGNFYHQQPEAIHSKIHLWKVSAVCVSCHRQNKNVGNHSRSQSDFFPPRVTKMGIVHRFSTSCTSDVLTRKRAFPCSFYPRYGIFHLSKIWSLILCNTLPLIQAENRYFH